MSVLETKLRRDLFDQKGMLLAIAAIVAVGVACLVGLQGVSTNLIAAKSSLYATCRMADFWVDLKKAPVAELTSLAQIDGITEMRSLISAPVMVDFDEVDRPLSGLLLSMPESPEPVINGLVMMSGGYFTDARDDEVIVNSDFARARHLAAGDILPLVIHGQRKELHVVGTAISSEFTYLMPPGSIVPEPADFGVFYVKRRFAEDMLDFGGAANTVVGRLTPQARALPETVLATLEQRLAEYGVFAVTPLAQQSSNLALDSELGGLASMATMMPLIFLSVAALVLNVLMTRLTEKQRMIVGALKALGYTNGVLFRHYLAMAVIVSMVGAILGVVMGYGIAAYMTEFYQSFFTFPDLHNTFYPGVAIISVVVSACFGILGAWRGVKKVAGLSPAEAMHDAPPMSGGRILLERLPWVWLRLSFRSQLVLRNIFRNPIRSLVAVFAAAMGSAMLVATFGTLDALQYMVEFQFNKVLLADYTLAFRDERDGGAVFEAQRMPGIVRAEPVFNVPCTFVSENHTKKGLIQGIVNNATMTVPRNERGEAVRVPSTGLLMTRRLADILHITQGGSVLVVPTKGEQRPVRVPVVGVIDSMFGLSVYADFDYLNELVDERDAVSMVQLAADQTAAEKRAFTINLKRYPTLEGFGDVAAQKESMKNDFVAKMGAMSYPMIFFGAVIFFGSILNGSLIALVERRREIATYRVLGYRPFEVGNLFLRENLLLNMTGTLLGLAPGYALLSGLASQYTNNLYRFPVVMTTGSWIWCIGLAVIFVFISQIIIQRAVFTMHWQDALAMKE
ncbi:ABC transporter permease [Desulfovibrio inopinatus]|uniref:ABC transporter permease n=1 Tax=Desulfovibrio inopinatus TaxID=102109 RepID=UPI000400E5C7|nr:ABC transporter permease [Desulfovibrio inopinatus]